MDCHLQALKSEVLREILPMLQSQKQDLKSEIDKIDRDRKRDQKTIDLEIHSLKQKLQGRENSSMGNAVKFLEKQYHQQIQTFNTLAENLAILSSSMQKQEIPKSQQKKTSDQQQSSSNFLSSNKEKSIVSAMSKHLDKFKIECNERIEKIRNNYQWHQLLGNIPIVEKPVNKFYLVNKIRKIRIGIIDQKYINDQDSFEQKRSRCIFCQFDNLNQMTVYAEGKAKPNEVRRTPMAQNTTNTNPLFTLQNNYTSFIDLTQTRSSQPFSLSESGIIKMKVEGNTIYWYEDQIVKAILTTPTVQESSMNWVPFIMMRGSGEKIDWS